MTPEQIKFVFGFEPDHNLGESGCDICKLMVIIREQEAEIESLRAKLKPVKNVYDYYKRKNIIHDRDYLHDTRSMMEEVLFGIKGSYTFDAVKQVAESEVNNETKNS